MQKHKYVDLTELSVDPGVQRTEGLDSRRVENMAAKFNPSALGSLIVSRRSNGELVVIDGMHRTETCRRVGYRGKLSAIVHEGLTPEQERKLFVLYNNTKSVSMLTKFVQRAQYGDPVAVELNRIILSHGWTPGAGSSDGTLHAVDALEKVYVDGARSVERGAHPELADKTLAIITGAWGHDWRATNGIILKGVGKFLGRWSEEKIDYHKVISELQLMTPNQLRGKAKSLTELQGGTQDAAIARILTNLHNSRRRSNLLPEWVWSR